MHPDVQIYMIVLVSTSSLVSLNYKYAFLNHVSLSCKIKVSSLYHMFLSYKCNYISLSKLCTLYVVYDIHVIKMSVKIVAVLWSLCLSMSSIYLVHFHKVRKILNSQNLIYMTSKFLAQISEYCLNLSVPITFCTQLLIKIFPFVFVVLSSMPCLSSTLTMPHSIISQICKNCKCLKLFFFQQCSFFSQVMLHLTLYNY